MYNYSHCMRYILYHIPNIKNKKDKLINKCLSIQNLSKGADLNHQKSLPETFE